MPVTVDEFQENLNRYLDIVITQDVFIMQDGEIIAKVTNPHREPLAGKICKKTSFQADFPLKLTKRKNSAEIENAINSLIGVLPETDMTLEDYKAERLAKYENLA